MKRTRGLVIVLLSLCACRHKPSEIYIPAGELISGAPPEWGALNVESGFQRKWLPGFYVDRLLVTKAEYEACVSASACVHEPELEGFAYADVTFDSATAYCRWRGKRLPTPLEFERMARGTDGWGTVCSPSPNANCSRDPPARSGVEHLMIGQWVDLRDDDYPSGAMMGVVDAVGIHNRRGDSFNHDPVTHEMIRNNEPLHRRAAFRCVRSAAK